MSKLILPPATADSNTHEVAFVKTLPGQEDAALAELIKQHIEAENEVNRPQSNAALKAGIVLGLVHIQHREEYGQLILF
ncbi:hypothetical protein [Kosakonia sp. S42]|uniref:hypothetical protein n=1 Tax=Kosakonia sp. S42 TaxID=2767458 RepID=UPI00190A5AE2|nr:hypothetical protein [Kosakonia sp. S42]MBK0019626.1 hypothetical protein [Kosakonia sp. S42]